MSIPCAWCEAPLPSAPPGGHPPDAPESRGICSGCASVLRDHLDLSFSRFESENGVPVVLVTEEVRVVDANPAAVDMLGGDPEALIGHLGGEVFGCENSVLAGRCGTTPQCEACTVRQTVTATWESGEPRVRVPAMLAVMSHAKPTKVRFLVTTARVGDKVLLRIDSPGSGNQGHGR